MTVKPSVHRVIPVEETIPLDIDIMPYERASLYIDKAKSWGVVNIGEMPFEKYNLYTERLLYIISTLAEHSIEEALSYESIIRKEENDEDSGLPLFSQFYRMLDEETRRSGVRKGDFSIVLVDFTNFGIAANQIA